MSCIPNLFKNLRIKRRQPRDYSSLVPYQSVTPDPSLIFDESLIADQSLISCQSTFSDLPSISGPSLIADQSLTSGPSLIADQSLISGPSLIADQSISGPSTVSSQSNYCINDLPNGILEHIIGFLPPYGDFKNCMLVCKKWHSSVKSVIRRKKLDFNRALQNFNTEWKYIDKTYGNNIEKRYGHCACVHGNFMFVFGGCGANGNIFNDLWRLNLTTRGWTKVKPRSGSPVPRTNASLMYYKNNLLLFGGCVDLSPYEQPLEPFNDTNIFDIINNCWKHIDKTIPSCNYPPPLTGHTATVHKDYMIVFGGYRKLLNEGESNDIWCLNLITYRWTKKETTEVKPLPRYGHSQIATNDDHLIILGGWQQNLKLNDDVWMLNMSGTVWVWSRISISNPQSAAPQLWCQPACKVGDLVVVLCKHPSTDDPQTPPLRRRPVTMLAVDFDDALLETRESRRELFRKLEEHLRMLNGGKLPMDDLPLIPARMAMYVLDVSEVLENGTAKWLPVKSHAPGGPYAKTLFSLVYGNSELILVGGIDLDPGFRMSEQSDKLNLSSKVKDYLYLISAPHSCI